MLFSLKIRSGNKYLILSSLLMEYAHSHPVNFHLIFITTFILHTLCIFLALQLPTFPSKMLVVGSRPFSLTQNFSVISKTKFRLRQYFCVSQFFPQNLITEFSIDKLYIGITTLTQPVTVLNIRFVATT